MFAIVETYLFLAIMFLTIDIVLLFIFNYFKKKNYITVKDKGFILKCLIGSYVNCVVVGPIRLMVWLPFLSILHVSDSFQTWWADNFMDLRMYYVSGQKTSSVIYFIVSVLIVIPFVRKYVKAWILDKKELQPIKKKMSIILTIGITPWILLHPGIEGLAEGIMSNFM